MKLLLDTHAMLWAIGFAEKLGKRSTAVLLSDDSEIHVSAASVWEVAIKRSLGKLRSPWPLRPILLEYGFTLLPITLEHAEAVADLPMVHRDPFDRLIVAQSLTESLVLMTDDPMMDRYGVAVLDARF